MEFRIEDILKNIIPGMIFIIGILILYFNGFSYPDFIKFISTDIKEYSEIILVLLLVASYIAGYLVDSLSSILEHYCIYKIFGTPSLKLLTGKGDRIKLVNHVAVLDNINTKCYTPPDTSGF